MISLISVAVLLVAAPADSLMLESRIEPSSVTIGDRVRMTLEVTHPGRFTVVPPDFVDGYGSLQLLSSAPLDREIRDGISSTKMTFVFQVIGLDFIDLPSFQVLLKKDESTTSITVPPMLLRVESVLSSADAEPRDLKPPLPVPRAYPFYVSLGLLLLIAALVIIAVILMRRRRTTVKVEIVRPAHEIAFESLRGLKESGLIESSDYHMFFVELSRILREYLGRRYGFDAMEMTTTELGRRLSEVPVPSDVSVEGLRVLFESDLVKFAKHKPEIARCQKFYSTVWNIVESTMETEKEDMEEEISGA
jgi:hypothetical protein